MYETKHARRAALRRTFNLLQQKPARVAACARRCGPATLAALAIGAPAALVAGCGAGDPAAGAPDPHSVTLSQAGVVQAGDGPVNTSIEIDDTAFGQGPVIAGQVTQAVLAAASTSIQQGGELRVALVGRDAYRDVVLYQGSIPSVAELDDLERRGTETQITAGLQATITAAFDPAAPETPAMRAALRRLHADGSDLARALGVAVDTAAMTDGDPSAAILLTDGVNDTPGLRLTMRVLAEPGLPHRLAALAGAEGIHRVDLIAMLGVGQVPIQYETRRSSAFIARLVGDWRRTCDLLHPGDFTVRTEL